VGAEKAKVFLEIYKNQIVYSAVLHIVLYNCKVIADGEVDLKILAEGNLAIILTYIVRYVTDKLTVPR